MEVWNRECDKTFSELFYLVDTIIQKMDTILIPILTMMKLELRESKLPTIIQLIQ